MSQVPADALEKLVQFVNHCRIPTAAAETGSTTPDLKKSPSV